MGPDPNEPDWLQQSYDKFPRIEKAFQAALGETLHPRSPELLYELARDLELPHGSLAVDVGCGEGTHSYRLAKSFGFSVTGIDPVPRHVVLATAGLESLDADVGAPHPLHARSGGGAADRGGNRRPRLVS
ncbi:MAG TPA: methyltransferase domain-containing protein [Gaiellaceae bacterium]